MGNKSKNERRVGEKYIEASLNQILRFICPKNSIFNFDSSFHSVL